MKVLVTGATGFVGSNLTEALLREGVEVRIFRRSDSPRQVLEGLEVEEVLGDIRDPEAVEKAVQGCTVVFHPAGIVSFNDRQKRYQYEVNVLGTKNIAAASRKWDVERLIFTSTVNAIGFPTQGVGDENTKFNFETGKYAYCETKKMAEDHLLEEAKKGLPVVVVNPGTMFGPKDVYSRAGDMIIQTAKGRMRAFMAGGSSFCNVKDVVEGHIQAWKKGKIGERYIMAGENLHYRDIFCLIAKKLQVPAPRYEVPGTVAWLSGGIVELGGWIFNREPVFTRTMARFSGIFNHFSSEKAIRELGYQPRPCDIGIEEAIQWYRQRNYI